MHGSGPDASPCSYDRSASGESIKLYVEEMPGASAVSGGGFVRCNLPRNSQRAVLLGDPCNDKNDDLPITPCHAAFSQCGSGI